MIWKEGDIVCRNKMLSPAYVVIKITDYHYVLEAITLTEYTLLLEKYVGKEVLHHPIPISFPHKIWMRKEFNKIIVTARAWDIIPPGKAYDYMQKHPLRDDELLKKYHKYIKVPRIVRLAIKNTDEINAPVIMNKGREMYMPTLNKPKPKKRILRTLVLSRKTKR